MVVPPTHPVAERVDEPMVFLLVGVAVGRIGAAVVFIETTVVAVPVHPLAFVTLKV